MAAISSSRPDFCSVLAYRCAKEKSSESEMPKVLISVHVFGSRSERLDYKICLEKVSDAKKR